MKFFKFLTFMSIALISLGFTSCSDDDETPSDNKQEQLTVTKRLKSLTCILEVDRGPEPYSTTTVLSDFTYDSEGQILSYQESSTNSSTSTITYEYSDAKITVSEQDNPYSSLDYQKSGSLIRSLKSTALRSSYTYNDNYLKRYTDSDITATYEWGTGIERAVFKDDYQTENITYSYMDKVCPSALIYYGFKYLPYYDCEIDPVLADAGYFGEKLTPKLLTEYSLHHSDGRVWGSVFSYEFDKDGYVTLMTVIGTGGEAGYNYKYTYVWE